MHICKNIAIISAGIEGRDANGTRQESCKREAENSITTTTNVTIGMALIKGWARESTRNNSCFASFSLGDAVKNVKFWRNPLTMWP